MGALLAQYLEETRKENAIYYISKKMLPYEEKYSPLEKTCIALVWATCKLKHVAPMACGVADRQQNRLVFAACRGQCRLSPRIPVHGVVGVLEQIRRPLLDQPIRTCFPAHKNSKPRSEGIANSR